MIGIFDSGMGGLTVMRAIRSVLPSSDIVYFGDTKHAPYGVRSRRELSELTIDGLNFLHAKGATSIVSACNSVSASLAFSLLDAFPLPNDRLVEMVAPTVRAFRGTNARVALCATQATIDSGIYQDAFRMLGQEIYAFSIPDLAGALERGASDEEMNAMIHDALLDVPAFDVLVLACTHYPLVQHLFRSVVGPDIVIFDPAIAVAEHVEDTLWPREVGEGIASFYISAESTPFREMVTRVFPGHIHTIEVVE